MLDIPDLNSAIDALLFGFVDFLGDFCALCEEEPIVGILIDTSLFGELVLLVLLLLEARPDFLLPTSRYSLVWCLCGCR